MADPIADFTTAADGLATVLAGVTDTSLTTPCEGWTIQELLDHVVGGARYYAAEWGGTEPSDEGSLVERYARYRNALVDVVSQEGVLERMVPSPVGGELPAGVMFGMFTTDTLLHTWDLGRALGERVELDPELLHRSWQNAIPLDDVLRGPGIFGPKLEVGDDESPQVQALAFFGRDGR
jgi:uncharacterized protein (TIGR03086 family)